MKVVLFNYMYKFQKYLAFSFYGMCLQERNV